MGLKVRVDGDGSGFSATLDKLAKDAANFGNSLSSKVSGNFSQAIMGVVPGLSGAIAGIFSAEAIKHAISEFAELGETIKFGAIRLNVDTDTFQRVQNVLKVTKGDIGQVETAFDKLAVAATHIEQGTAQAGKLRQAFAELGVTGEDLKSQDYQKLFFQIAEGMKGINPSKEQISALRDIFGKGGDNLLPAMKVGFDSPVATSGILDKEALASIDSYNEDVRNAGAATAGMFNRAKEAGLDLWHTVRLSVNPFFWADRAGQVESTGYDKKFAQDQAAKVMKIDADKRKAEAAAEDARKHQEKVSKGDAAKAAEIDKATNAIKEQHRLEALSPEQRKLELLRQIASLQEKLADPGDHNTLTQDAELRRKIEKAKGELATVEKQMEKPKHEHKNMMERLGNASIGGIMLSHGGNDALKHAAATAKAVESIDKKTRPARGASANDDYTE